MKIVIAFTILLLAATAFELSDEITEEEMQELYKAMEPVDMEDTDLMRGNWEVVGVPGVIMGLHKGTAGARSSSRHRGCIKYTRKNMRNFRAAKNLIHKGLKGKKGYNATQHYKEYVCSYAYIRTKGWGHTVWCFDREELGDGGRLMRYKRGAFFTGGYML
jgi:hypothetical protein